MSDTSVQIVGIKVTPSSKDNTKLYYTYYYIGHHSDYDKEHAVEIEGSITGSEFCMVDIGCHVGDVIEFKYGKGFQDKAVVIGCTIIKPAPEKVGK